jgi:hypothetical protein
MGGQILHVAHHGIAGRHLVVAFILAAENDGCVNRVKNDCGQIPLRPGGVVLGPV